MEAVYNIPLNSYKPLGTKVTQETVTFVDKFHIVITFIIYEVFGTYFNHELGSLGYDEEEETQVIYTCMGTSITYLEVHNINNRPLKIERERDTRKLLNNRAC